MDSVFEILKLQDKMKKITAFLSAALISSAAFAQNPLPFDPEVRVGRLNNGLTYYIRHNDKPAQRADFYLATNAGALYETPDQDGLAHFLEHMCFNGLKNLPGKTMLEYLQSIGCSFGGNINASTGVEVTQYMLNNVPVVREGIIDTCLLVMHDYSHFVLCDPAEIDAERGVILEEKRTRNTAGWRIREASAKYYYGDSKYATTTIIGTEENLKTFRPESLVNFYHTWYRPDNQAVIVVGDVDVDQIEAKLTALFADIPAPEAPLQRPAYMIPDNEEPVIGVVTDPEMTGNNVNILWKRPAFPEQYNNTDQKYFLDLISTLVFDEVLGERFNDITSKPGAPFLQAGLGNGKFCETCDALFAFASFKNGQDLEAVTALLTEVERLKRYGVTAAELQRAKDNLLADLEKTVQGAETRKSPEFIPGLISAFFDNTPFMTPQTELELAKAVCAQVTPELVAQVVPQYITDRNMVVVLAGSGLVEHPDENALREAVLAVRSAEIAAPVEEESGIELLDASAIKGSKVRKSAPTIAGATEWTLKNGLRVVVLPTEYKKDEVSIKLDMLGGESLVTDEELYSFDDNVWALYLRNTGIGNFSSSELSKVLAGKKVSCNPWIGLTSHGIEASAAPKDVETALQLLYMTFMTPRFDPDEFQIGIDQIRAVLPNLEADPRFQLQKRLPGDLYPGSSRRFTTSAEVIDKASLENLEKAYRRLFDNISGATVYVVGNVDPAEFKPLAEKYLGALPKSRKAAAYMDDGTRFRKGYYEDHFKVQMTTPKVTVLQVYTADLPATVENELLLSATTYVLNMLYTDLLREEEGGTYGASVYGQFQKRPVETAMFQVYFDTNVDQAAVLEELARKGVRDLAQNGPSDDYFNRTVEYFKTKMPQNRISNSYWMNVLNLWQNYGIEADTERETAINALTREKVAAMARQILDSGNFVEIRMMPQAE